MSNENFLSAKDLLKNKARNRNLIKNYGITLDRYNEMLEQQNGVCKICKGIDSWRNLCVDHDHETGEVRALLCTSCNVKMGWLTKNQLKNGDTTAPRNCDFSEFLNQVELSGMHVKQSWRDTVAKPPADFSLYATRFSMYLRKNTNQILLELSKIYLTKHKVIYAAIDKAIDDIDKNKTLIVNKDKSGIIGHISFLLVPERRKKFDKIVANYQSGDLVTESIVYSLSMTHLSGNE